MCQKDDFIKALIERFLTKGLLAVNSIGGKVECSLMINHPKGMTSSYCSTIYQVAKSTGKPVFLPQLFGLHRKRR